MLPQTFTLGVFPRNKRSFNLKRCNCIKVVIWLYLRHQHNNARPLVKKPVEIALSSLAQEVVVAGETPPSDGRHLGDQMGWRWGIRQCVRVCVCVCVCLSEEVKTALVEGLHEVLTQRLHEGFSNELLLMQHRQKITAPSVFSPLISFFLLFRIQTKPLIK